jgi:hypothetical protein
MRKQISSDYIIVLLKKNKQFFTQKLNKIEKKIF